jgi:hypothetical protein
MNSYITTGLRCVSALAAILGLTAPLACETTNIYGWRRHGQGDSAWGDECDRATEASEARCPGALPPFGPCTGRTRCEATCVLHNVCHLANQAACFATCDDTSWGAGSNPSWGASGSSAGSVGSGGASPRCPMFAAKMCGCVPEPSPGCFEGQVAACEAIEKDCPERIDCLMYGPCGAECAIEACG